MTLVKLETFSGEIPRCPAHLLPENAAQMAVNCDFSHGELRSLRAPGALRPMAGAVRSVFSPAPGIIAAWPVATRAIRGTTIDDSYRRVYFENAETGFRVTTIDEMSAPALAPIGGDGDKPVKPTGGLPSAPTGRPGDEHANDSPDGEGASLPPEGEMSAPALAPIGGDGDKPVKPTGGLQSAPALAQPGASVGAPASWRVGLPVPDAENIVIEAAVKAVVESISLDFVEAGGSVKPVKIVSVEPVEENVKYRINYEFDPVEENGIFSGGDAFGIGATAAVQRIRAIVPAGLVGCPPGFPYIPPPPDNGNDTGGGGDAGGDGGE